MSSYEAQKRVGTFEKVSELQWVKDMIATDPDISRKHIGKAYDKIAIPERSTGESAGYDFRTPFAFELRPGESIMIPTGIRCKIDNGHFLALVPRSSVGIKRNTTLMNTIGVIDADYYNAKNEGHIMIVLQNNNKSSIFSWENKKRTWFAKENERICQGIFLPYCITYDDQVNTERKGGIGSTGK